GQDGAPVPDFVDSVTQVLAFQTVPFGSPGDPTGSLTEYVVTGTGDNPFGNNDVTFAFGLSLTSDDVASISMPGYAGFDTAVKSCNIAGECVEAAGDVVPTTASRSANGDVVEFYFSTPVTSSAPSGGFVIYTNAKTYADPPMIEIADTNGNVSFASEFVPSAVPEPQAWMSILAGIGLAGAALRRARRGKARASIA
ncbi:MAG: PEP-CTERM sorting domain-containing protein, partial [Caulobacteraceae bacterium]